MMQKSTQVLRFITCLIGMLCCFGVAQAQENKKTVALTTFFVDRQIGVSELSNTAAFTAELLTMAKDTNFNLQPVLDSFKTAFFTDFAKNFTFALKPENEVIENKDYQAFEEADMLNIARPLVVKGYKIMFPGGFLQKKENRNQNEMLKVFPDVDGIMFVFMDFEFVKKIAIGNSGTAGIRALCNIWLYNKEGKSVFKIREGAVSKGTVALVRGVPLVSVEKILPLCKDAADKVMEDLMGRLPKMAKKAGDKL